MSKIYGDFIRIIDKELALEMNKNQKNSLIQLRDPLKFLNIARRLMEIAKNSTVLRCGNNIGHLTNDVMAYESDAAHTNLVRAIANYAFDFIYGWDVNPPNYTRREIDEAALIHDLPENEIGDIPDNGDRDDKGKQIEENAYYRDFLSLYDTKDANACYYIEKLIKEMREQSSEAGRVLYLADKTAAIVMMLTYDYLGKYPYACPGEKNVSLVNLEEMKVCDVAYRGGNLLSEIWSADFFYARELTRFDDSGFFTAVLVMLTLLVRGKWYDWREKMYLP